MMINIMMNVIWIERMRLRWLTLERCDLSLKYVKNLWEVVAKALNNCFEVKLCKKSINSSLVTISHLRNISFLAHFNDKFQFHLLIKASNNYIPLTKIEFNHKIWISFWSIYVIFHVFNLFTLNTELFMYLNRANLLPYPLYYFHLILR